MFEAAGAGERQPRVQILGFLSLGSLIYKMGL